jgi:hypothetical protein
MAKIFDDSMSLRRPCQRLQHRKAGYGNWTEGDVLTPDGIVSVYSQDGESTRDRHTRLDFVAHGRLYMRHINGKCYSHRGLVTIAARFAAEMVSQ